MESPLDLLAIPAAPGPWQVLAFPLDVTLRATLALAAAALAGVALRRAAASVRHLVWASALAGALALPPLMLALPSWRVPILPTAGSGARAAGRGEAPAGPRAPVAPEIPARVAADGPARGERTIDPPRPAGAPVSGLGRAAMPTPATRPWGRPAAGCWAVGFAAAWGVGAVAVLLPWLAGHARLRQLGRRSARSLDGPLVEVAERLRRQLGPSRRVALLRGDATTSPMTWGVLRPVILMPAGAEDWPVEQLRAVLLHELAHVKRWDCLTQTLARLACAVYWFHPLAWMAAHGLRVESERACDDVVLQAGARATEYATHLLDVARALRSCPRLSAAAVPMARPSQLEGRIRAILDARRARRGPARWLVAACLLAVLGASATLAAVRLVAREMPGPVVDGLVVGPDGKPLEGADVVVLVSRPSSRGPWEDPTAAALLGRGRSDARGNFRIEVPDDRVVEPEDRLLLVATARGAGFAARALADLAGPVEGPIRLVAEQPVEVRLVDLEGSPIAGAAVGPRYAYPSSGGEGLSPDALTKKDLLPALARGWTTDADGRFTVRGYGPGHALGLQVRAAGFGSQQLRLSLEAGVGAATLALGRAHVVEGRVTLGQGGPPAVGALVRSQSMSEKHGIGQFLGVADATTDGDGRYRIEAAPGGSIRLEVEPPRQGADAYLLRGDLVVPGDSVASRVDFALPRGVLVRGRVTEAGNGRPVAGAVVTHRAHERNNPYFIKGNSAWFNGDEQKAITAADGTFRLGVMPGPGYLLVKGPTADYLHEEIPAVALHGELIWPNTRHYPDALRKLDPRPDEGPLDLELTLRRGATVRGRLIGPDGQPVRDAVLFSRWYLPPAQMTINFGQRVLPTRGGRFELGGCDPGSSAPVFFLDAKGQRGAVVELSGKQAGQDLEVTLQPCGSATVRLVDDRGKPLRPGRRSAHLEVVLTPGASFADILRGDNTTSPLMADAIMVANLDRERYRDLKTDQEGRMTFPTLIPGATYRVIVHNQPVKTQIEFTVRPGEAKDLGDLVIRNIEQAG